jgi:hypothetical protein
MGDSLLLNPFLAPAAAPPISEKKVSGPEFDPEH